MKPKDYAIRAARRVYRLSTRSTFLNPECVYDRQEANRVIYEALLAPNPFMLSRFGTTELNCINNFLCVESKGSSFRKVLEYIAGNTHTPWWNVDHLKYLSEYSGIFPPNIETAAKFSQRYLTDIPSIDILGSFQYQERYMPLRSDIKRLQLETLYPFYVASPWTAALAGRRVLVVHPFKNTIEKQYEKRREIFENEAVLPDFQLIAYQSVQSIAGTKVPFKDWFEALAHMESDIERIDFDVAILGCGAYGLPLAAHIKRMGKKALHIGGGTQLLFGIKGRRWLEDYKGVWKYRPGVEINLDYTPLFNNHWVFPGEEERPPKADNVEQACYW